MGGSALSEVTGPYELVESDGAVVGVGGGVSRGALQVPAGVTVVGAAAAPGGGYWLVGSNGVVHAFGSATRFGTPWAGSPAAGAVGMAATPDGRGAWVVTGSGAVASYGDALSCPAVAAGTLSGPVAGIVGTPDGGGYWLFTSSGQVVPFGDALAFAGAATDGSALVGMAPTADGRGYWLTYADGFVAAAGDAVTYGSLPAAPLTPVSGVVAAANGEGYLVVTQAGQVTAFGQASSEGSLGAPPPGGVTVVAIVPATSPATPTPAPSPTPAPTPAPLPPLVPLKGDPFAHGSIGYDVSNFQCKRHDRTVRQAALPKSTALTVVEVAGWLDGATNSCLSSLLGWASAAATRHDPDSLYLFLNAPTTAPGAVRQDATGPAGTCARLVGASQAGCRAYNYGYNGAVQAMRYAASQGARLPLWWLDVEGGRSNGEYAQFSAGNYWSTSKALNDRTIQGAIDALHKAKETVGLYSSSIQYANIAGSYVPSGGRLPLWVAGVPWTSPPYTEKGLPSRAILSAWCAGTAHYAGSKLADRFAGGVPWLLQETPGSLPSPYGIDPDYAC
ncbi:MAG: hypothetical protein M0T71_00450 [Actinomycetota bacterium]|nr:hypothetical protein [Actinomycetota bacterium]